jgi:glycosidase
VNLIKDQYPKNIQNNLMTIIGSHDTVRPLTVLGINENTVNYSDREDYKLTQEEYTRGVQNLKIASLMQFTVMGIPTLFYGDEVGIQGTLDPFCRKPYPWEKEDKEIFEWYKSLAKLRENPVFDGGELNIKYACDSLLIYERVKGYKKVIIAINKGGESQTFTLTKTMKDYISQKSVSGDIEIEPNGYKILIY